MFDFLNVCAICDRLVRTCWLLVGRFFENDFFHERGPRGRSRHENSAKNLAAAFSRREYFMVLGWREGEAVEALKHHSTLCARGKAWTAKAGDHRRKA